MQNPVFETANMVRKKRKCGQTRNAVIGDACSISVGVGKSLQHLFRDIDDDTPGQKEDHLLGSFCDFACSYGFRNDPRSTILNTSTLNAHLVIIKKHLKLVSLSQRYVSTMLHRFLLSVKTVQRAFRAFLKSKSEQITFLISRWRSVENTARCRIKREILMKENDCELVGTIRLSGGHRLQMLKSLYNDCWTSEELKRESLELLWLKSRKLFVEQCREWRKEKAINDAKQASAKPDLLLQSLLDPKDKEKGGKRVTTKVDKFSTALSMPRFREVFDCRKITIKQLIEQVGVSLEDRNTRAVSSFSSPRPHKQDNVWLRYYTGLLHYRSKALPSLIELSFQLSGKKTLPEQRPPPRTLHKKPPHECPPDDPETPHDHEVRQVVLKATPAPAPAPPSPRRTQDVIIPNPPPSRNKKHFFSSSMSGYQQRYVLKKTRREVNNDKMRGARSVAAATARCRPHTTTPHPADMLLHDAQRHKTCATPELHTTLFAPRPFSDPSLRNLFPVTYAVSKTGRKRPITRRPDTPLTYTRPATAMGVSCVSPEPFSGALTCRHVGKEGML